jgi:hypothetical protein
MSTAPATPAPVKKPSVWDKIKKFLSSLNADVENVTLNELPALKQFCPPVASMAAKILNCDIHMQAAITTASAEAPAGASKAQRALLVAGAIGQQLVEDAAAFGKDVTSILPQLITSQQNFIAAIASAPNLSTAPSASQADAAVAAAGEPTA